MVKKFLILLVIALVIAVASIPMWTSKMAEEAFSKPDKPLSPKAVKKAVNAKMYIYLFDEARLTSEKAVIYFPESEEMPFFIYSAAICATKTANNDAALYWYNRFLEKYPKHEWANQAERARDTIANLNR